MHGFGPWGLKDCGSAMLQYLIPSVPWIAPNTQGSNFAIWQPWRRLLSRKWLPHMAEKRGKRGKHFLEWVKVLVRRLSPCFWLFFFLCDVLKPMIAFLLIRSLKSNVLFSMCNTLKVPQKYVVETDNTLMSIVHCLCEMIWYWLLYC